MDSDSPDLNALVDLLPKTKFGEGEEWSNGKTRFQMFPEGYIALNKELATGLHPKLEVLLNAQPNDEIDIKLSQIAVYCEIVLDGTYDIASRDKLCFILAGRLSKLREAPNGIILSS